MKPFRIFIFYATVIMWLFFIALLIPQQGIGVSGDLRLHFMNVSDLFREDTLKMDEKVELLDGILNSDSRSGVSSPNRAVPSGRFYWHKAGRNHFAGQYR